MADRNERVSAFADEANRRLTTRRAFADMVRLSERSVDRLIADGTIPICRFDQAVLVDVEGGRAALAARK